MLKKILPLALGGFFITLLVFLRWLLPPVLMYAPFDDSLYIARAKIIHAGELYNYTFGFNPLVKGVGYPYVLAAAKYASIPSLVFTFIILILGILILSLVIFKLTKSIYLGLFFIIIVLVDPHSFSFSASKISREMTHQSFLLVSIALLLFSFLIFNKQSQKSKNFLLGILSGIFVLISFNTREEHIWLYLTFAVLFLVALFILENKKNIILTFVAFLITFLSGNQLLQEYHYRIYEVKLINTTTAGEFPRLMQNLAAIETGLTPVPYASISKEKRELAYSASPSFKKLKPYLEGPGQAWIQYGCNDSNTCGDYANGWFHVAMREGIRSIGKWDSQKDAQRFMRKASGELQSACQEGTLGCKQGIPIAPALGIIKLHSYEYPKILSSFSNYFLLSFSNWGGNTKSFVSLSELPTGNWNDAVNVIQGIPENQSDYGTLFNSRWLHFSTFFAIWNQIYTIISIVGFILFIFFVIRKIRDTGNSASKLLLIIGVTSFSAWLLRGILLSVTEATSFLAVNSLYATSGRVFFSIVVATGFIYLFLYFADTKKTSFLDA